MEHQLDNTKEDVETNSHRFGSGPSADFETAISATGYGKFNILLLLVAVSLSLSSEFVIGLPSYIIPIAVCDLNLSMSDKGILNAVSFIGMASSGPVWGPLLDTVGRRKMLFIGVLLNFFLYIATSMSQTFTYMAICNLLGGTVAGGLYIGAITYVQEFHSLEYRGRIQLIMGAIYTIVNLILPILASIFLPLKLNVTILNFLEYRSWNLLLLVVSLPSLIAAISLYCLPESPKYLMSAGENEKAMMVFQKIYSNNIGKPVTAYPISKLITEKQYSEKLDESKMSLTGYVKDGIKQISPLFSKRYLPKIILVCMLEPLLHMTFDTFRLWLPQIFQAMHEYSVENNETGSLCTVLEIFHPEDSSETTCSVNTEDNSHVYINSMIVSSVVIAVYFTSSFFINLFKRKFLLIGLAICSGTLAMSIYFAQNVPSLLTLVSLHIAFTGVCYDIVLSIIVAMFPTTLRGSAVSIALFFGRLMTVFGNMVFPILLQLNCEVPFASMAVVMFVENTVDFETAISSTGFGKFNILLLLVTLPAAWSVQFESVLTSFILPAAECDLNLSLGDKGLINAVIFIGSILSGPIWGFLLDTIGRQKMLFIGSLLAFLVNLASSFTQTFLYLMVLKLIGGSLQFQNLVLAVNESIPIIGGNKRYNLPLFKALILFGFRVGGIYVGYVTYLQEFHSSKYRGRIQMVVGLIYNSPNLVIPLLASYFLPLKFDVTLFNLIEFRSWNLLFLIGSLPSLASAISFYFLPESPKYLMSTGRNSTALNVFRNVYHLNKGKQSSEFPIKNLFEEKRNNNELSEHRKTFAIYLRNGWTQISPLFSKQYATKFFLVSIIQPLIQMSMNTFRLWLPQIFQSIHDYQVQNNGSSSNLCTMIEIFYPEVSNENEQTCKVNLENNFSVYFNSIIIAAATICGYLVAGSLINLFGRKPLAVVAGIGSSATIMALYFSTNLETILTLSSLNVAFTSVCFDAILSIIVFMFPTTLRGTAVSLTLLIGRLFTVVGNLVFPLLLESSCEGPFFTLGIIVLLATLLSFLLPNNVDNINKT